MVASTSEGKDADSIALTIQTPGNESSNQVDGKFDQELDIDPKVSKILAWRLSLKHAWDMGVPLRYFEEVQNKKKQKLGATIGAIVGAGAAGGAWVALTMPAIVHVIVPAAAPGVFAGPLGLVVGLGAAGAALALMGTPLIAPIFAAPGLHGAAAVANGLAFLGGGPAAAGGGGMAAGQMVLGLFGIAGGGGAGAFLNLLGLGPVPTAAIVAQAPNLISLIAAAVPGAIPAALAGLTIVGTIGYAMGRIASDASQRNELGEFKKMIDDPKNELYNKFTPNLLENAWILPRPSELQSRRWFDMASMEWISSSGRGFIYLGTFLNKIADGEGVIIDLAVFKPVFFGRFSEGFPNGKCLIFHPKRKPQVAFFRNGHLVQHHTPLLCKQPSLMKVVTKVINRKKTVFLSHAHKPHAQTAAFVAEELRGCGFNIFLDTESLDKISVLPHHVHKSDVFIVFLSKSYFKSVSCMVELVQAHRDQKKLIPLEVTSVENFPFALYKDSKMTAKSGAFLSKLFSDDDWVVLNSKNIIELDVLNAILWALDHISITVREVTPSIVTNIQENLKRYSH